jgi:branched-chain amino acid aminotransferase
MPLRDRKIWQDGRLVGWAEPTVHVLSHSIQRGSLVFDVMAVYETARGSVILGLREHVARFCRSARLNAMDLPVEEEGILGAIGEVVRANPGAEVVKISAYYPGISLDVLPVDTHPSIAIAAVAISDLIPGGMPARMRAARIQVARPIKAPPRVLSPQVKIAAGYTAAATAKAQARRDGFDDILFLDETGNIAESSTQSFLLVRGGTLHAPPTEYVLEGITRRAVLELAEDESVPVRIEPIPSDALASLDEAFLAGTTMNVWPVEQIDERTLPSPIPGPVSARLGERFERMIKGEDPVLSPRWMQPV